MAHPHTIAGELESCYLSKIKGTQTAQTCLSGCRQQAHDMYLHILREFHYVVNISDKTVKGIPGITLSFITRTSLKQQAATTIAPT
jgi:hypothetical protein